MLVVRLTPARNCGTLSCNRGVWSAAAVGTLPALFYPGQGRNGFSYGRRAEPPTLYISYACCAYLLAYDAPTYQRRTTLVDRAFTGLVGDDLSFPTTRQVAFLVGSGVKGQWDCAAPPLLLGHGREAATGRAACVDSPEAPATLPTTRRYRRLCRVCGAHYAPGHEHREQRNNIAW